MKPLSPKVIFVSHGGGPLPLLGDPAHGNMVTLMAELRHLITPPRAILLISAHWEERRPTLTSGANPTLVYDYYGFPRESYEITYPAPGQPQLARRVASLLEQQGLEPVLDESRGFDHGLFIPLKLLFPEADIPCVQLSLNSNFNPAEHILMGKALAALADDNVLVIGSGFTFHNMAAFFTSPPDQANDLNRQFDRWLMETLTSTTLSEQERTERLVHWDQAPAARFCHPREEHLLPLHVCYGAGGGPAAQSWSIEVIGKATGFFVW